MRFGPVPVADAVGAVLAHSLSVGAVRLKKGRRLDAGNLEALEAAGIASVTVAQPEPGDVDEDTAAAAVARALVPDPEAAGMVLTHPFTGRVNVLAGAAGVFRCDPAVIDALNAADPEITLATLPDWARVQPRQMLATIKIIPFAVQAAAVAQALAAVRPGALALNGFRGGRAALILTRTPGLRERLLAKAASAVKARLAGLGMAMAPPVIVAHDESAVAAAIAAAQGDMVLILGGSATSDAADVCPAGLVAAGGRLERLGMPVDPGNLLFLGEHGGRPVVGMPGSARSPAPSGVDRVLERLAAGIAVTGADIAAMGVGGLLKEIPARPQPRAGAAPATGRPQVAAIVLAAGAARRMRGRDKLLEDVGGRPMLRAAVDAAAASDARRVVAVLPPGAPARRAALDGASAEIVEAADAAEGMAASLRAGLAAVAATADAVVVMLADMPEVTADHVNRLIAAYDPARGREICRARSDDGRPGHPVLFGRRFFESLSDLRGDGGAREVIAAATEFLTDVPTPGRGATLDLDTPEDWAEWRSRHPGRPDTGPA